MTLVDWYTPQAQLTVAQKGKAEIPIASSRLMSIRFAEKIKGSALMTAALDNSDGVMYSAMPLFMKGSVLKLTFGYPGRMRGPIELINSGIPSGAERLEIKARIRTSKKGETRDGRISRSWNNLAITEAAELVAADMGYSGNLFHVDFDFEKHKQITQANETNQELMHRLADMSGRRFWIDETGMHFQLPASDLKPTAEFRWGNGADAPGLIVEYGLPKVPKRVPRKIKLQGVDPFTQKKITKEVDIRDSSMPVLSGDPIVDEDDDTIFVDKPFSFSDASVEAEALGMMRNIKLGAVKIGMKIFGDPFVRPGMTINVNRLADPLNGLWYIWESTQDMSSGYYTDLLVGREGYVRKTGKGKKSSFDTVKDAAGQLWTGLGKQFRFFQRQ